MARNNAALDDMQKRGKLAWHPGVWYEDTMLSGCLCFCVSRYRIFTVQRLEVQLVTV